MSQVVRLVSERDYAGRLPPGPVGHVIAKLPQMMRQSVSMAFRRRSAPKGRPPHWLAAASDVRLLGLTNGRSATIRLDAPTLGDASSELYDQGELFPGRPDPEDTALDVLGDVLVHVREGNADSDRFDDRLLKSVAALDQALNGEYQTLEINSRRYSRRSPAVLDKATIASARALHSRTPAPARVRVVGVLDAVRISTQTFGLKLDDGNEAKGILSSGSFHGVLELLASQRRVVVRGDAIFRPSGQLLLVEAEDVALATNESPVWSRMPRPRGGTLDVTGLRRPQGPRSGMAKILGRWPGDETDEEVEAALSALR